MSKKDNLMKFWESLESNRQSKSPPEIFKPCRGFSYSVKSLPCLAKSNLISQSDLSPRVNPVMSRINLTSLVREKESGVSSSEDYNGGQSLSSDKSEDVALPVLPRNEVLSHTTKSRVRTSHRPPIRQRRIVDQDIVKEYATSATIADQIKKDKMQTPPAATIEFTCSKYSPTSAAFLDETSPTSVVVFGKDSSTFSTFLGKPNNSPKIQPLKPLRRDSLPGGIHSAQLDAKSKLLSSPKCPSQQSKIEVVTRLKVSICNPTEQNKYEGQISTAADILHTPERKSASVLPSPTSILTPSKAATLGRRASVQAVNCNSPIKDETAALQAVTTPSKCATAFQPANTPSEAEIAVSEVVATTPRPKARTEDTQDTHTPYKSEADVLFAVTTPSKSVKDILQAFTTPPTPRTAGLQALNTSSNAEANVFKSISNPSRPIITTTKALTPVLQAGNTSSKSLTMTGGTQASWMVEMSRRKDIKSGQEDAGSRSDPPIAGPRVDEGSALADLKTELDKKMDKLEKDLAVEKSARVNLEKEVQDLKVFVTQLRLSALTSTL
eukprot:GFUD01024544.1.p1 GENE.GFUD01024544.1~~GFUD01024544.1.p1  ORF type:complete len:553 (+),score=131.76 GFUD01024544.1:40-1698(+)